VILVNEMHNPLVHLDRRIKANSDSKGFDKLRNQIRHKRPILVVHMRRYESVYVDTNFRNHSLGHS
jgi:hypothetical protein